MDGFNLTPSFNRDTQEYNLIVDSSVSNITVSAYVSDSNARVDGAGNVSLQNGGNDISIAVTAQNGSVRTYTIHVVKQDGGPTQGSGGSPVYGGGSSSGGIVSPDGSSGGSSGRQFRQQRRSRRFRRTGQSFRKRQRTRREAMLPL